MERAIADYGEVIKIVPGHAEAYGNRGLARFSLGRTTEAERDFNECFKLDAKLESMIAERVREIERQRLLK
jgi:hypothetical protein